MNIGDTVKANITENVLNPTWVNGVIISIYITPKTNFYLIYLENGEYTTLEEQYIQSV